MAESKQHVLTRIRRPRVHITYDVEIGEAIEKKELPFVVGVLADLSGNPEVPLPRLKDRKFVEIDRDNFQEVLSVINPRLVIRVENRLNDETPETSIELVFSEMEDFEPQRLAKNVPSLAILYEKRANLKNLIAKMDGNDPLESLLSQIMKNNDNLQKLAKEIQEHDEANKQSEESSAGEGTNEETKDE